MPKQPGSDDAKQVSVEYLLEGAFRSIRNALRLIKAACRDYAVNDFAGALERAVISREEVAKSRILADEAGKAASGNSLTFRELRSLLSGSHSDKQSKGMYGLTFFVEADSPLARALAARKQESPGTQAYATADAEVDRILRQMSDEAPDLFHASRLRALYVDPLNASAWTGPESVSQGEAFGAINAASNDYLMHRSRMTADAQSTDPGLAAAIAAWNGQSDVPLPPLGTLPPPP
jgi:AbiV family abortive infection protein